MLTVVCYSIYHSPNAYLGILLADYALQGFPVEIERRPIYIPKAKGVKVADLVGSKEPPLKGEYHREDCARWAKKYGIELNFTAPGVFEERAARWRQSPFDREELPARAYYAAIGTGKEALLDRALFQAAWVEGLDVNEESVVRRAASAAGLDPDRLIAQALQDDTRRMLEDRRKLHNPGDYELCDEYDLSTMPIVPKEGGRYDTYPWSLRGCDSCEGPS